MSKADELDELLQLRRTLVAAVARIDRHIETAGARAKPWAPGQSPYLKDGEVTDWLIGRPPESLDRAIAEGRALFGDRFPSRSALHRLRPRLKVYAKIQAAEAASKAQAPRGRRNR